MEEVQTVEQLRRFLFSSRKLAASLWWQLAAITNGGASVRRQCGFSFDRLGFESVEKKDLTGAKVTKAAAKKGVK